MCIFLIAYKVKVNILFIIMFVTIKNYFTKCFFARKLRAETSRFLTDSPIKDPVAIVKAKDGCTILDEAARMAALHLRFNVLRILVTKCGAHPVRLSEQECDMMFLWNGSPSMETMLMLEPEEVHALFAPCTRMHFLFNYGNALCFIRRDIPLHFREQWCQKIVRSIVCTENCEYIHDGLAQSCSVYPNNLPCSERMILVRGFLDGGGDVNNNNGKVFSSIATSSITVKDKICMLELILDRCKINGKSKGFRQLFAYMVMETKMDDAVGKIIERCGRLMYPECSPEKLLDGNDLTAPLLC